MVSGERSTILRKLQQENGSCTIREELVDVVAVFIALRLGCEKVLGCSQQLDDGPLLGLRTPFLGVELLSDDIHVIIACERQLACK